MIFTSFSLTFTLESQFSLQTKMLEIGISWLKKKKILRNIHMPPYIGHLSGWASGPSTLYYPDLT